MLVISGVAKRGLPGPKPKQHDFVKQCAPESNSGDNLSEMPDEAAKNSDTEEAKLTFTNLAAVKDLFKAFDRHQRFRLQTASDFFQNCFEVARDGTALYEKLVLLNGTTIALSITFLGYLSSRLATIHITEKPHLWMVAVAWSLLIVSIFCCYHVIVARHSAMLGLLGRVSNAHTEYIYQRLGVLLNSLGKLVQGSVAVGSEKVEFSKLTETLNTLLKNESDEKVKKTTEQILKWSESHEEKAFARIAIQSTILAVGFLCLFTILSLQLLF